MVHPLSRSIIMSEWQNEGNRKSWTISGGPSAIYAMRAGMTAGMRPHRGSLTNARHNGTFSTLCRRYSSDWKPLRWVKCIASETIGTHFIGRACRCRKFRGWGCLSGHDLLVPSAGDHYMSRFFQGKRQMRIPFMAIL